MSSDRGDFAPIERQTILQLDKMKSLAAGSKNEFLKSQPLNLFRKHLLDLPPSFDNQHQEEGRASMTVPSASSQPTSTAAGIVERADTGQRVVPESRRADGSIRKERKVRPGFTPVEDIARYRPGRARAGEDRRKREALGSATSASDAAATSSSASSPGSPVPLKSLTVSKGDNDSPSWRSNGGRTTTSQLSETSATPKSTPELSRPAETSADVKGAATTPASKSEVPKPVARPWQNSRLRKSAHAKEEKKETASIPDAWDQEESDKPSATTGETQLSADGLVSKLDNLRINGDKATKDA